MSNTVKTASDTVLNIRERVFDLFKADLAEDFVYHSFQHTQNTAEVCGEMADYYQLNKEQKESLLLAAWLHDTGFTESYQDHEEISCKIAKKWLQQEDYPAEKIEQVLELIRSTHHKHEAQGLLQEILHDADLAHLGQKEFFDRSDLLRMEWERVLNLKFSNTQWQKKQLEFLVDHHFLTSYAEVEYGARLEKNLKKQRKRLKKSRRRREKDKIKSRKLGRGIETMYRSTYRNHINLSSIADAKANMMISLNTIIMSVIITVVGSGFAFGGGLFESLRFTVPISILMIGSLIAVIFAVVSARPEVTKKKVDLQRIKNKKSSVLFFGNFTNLPLPKFLRNMQELKSDRDLLYDNMSIDIYHLGKVLDRKYHLLRISYTIFISGLTLAVISFLALLVYTNF